MLDLAACHVDQSETRHGGHYPVLTLDRVNPPKLGRVFD
jgi:hypothetical protein